MNALARYGRHEAGCEATRHEEAPWERVRCTCGSLSHVHGLDCERAIVFAREEPKWSRRKPKPCTCGFAAALAHEARVKEEDTDA